MFFSLNFTFIVCDKCGETTTILPEQRFEKLNCKCKEITNEARNRTNNKTKKPSTQT